MKITKLILLLAMLGGIGWAFSSALVDRGAGRSDVAYDEAPRRGRAFIRETSILDESDAGETAVDAELAAPPPPAPVAGSEAPPQPSADSPARDTAAVDPNESESAEGDPASESAGESMRIEFSLLSGFSYEVPSGEVTRETLPDQVPAEVKALDQADVAIKGYMIPLMVKSGNEVSSFVLVMNQLACCFGATPKMNEWIHVTMPDEAPARYLPDLPIVVFGRLTVEEELKRGSVVSLYRMEGTAVDGPRDWTKKGF